MQVDNMKFFVLLFRWSRCDRAGVRGLSLADTARREGGEIALSSIGSELTVLTQGQACQAYKSEVYHLPNQLHEIVASLHLPALGPDPERLGPERSVVMELFTLRLCSRLFSMPADKI